ncbi:cytochrome P450 71A1-like [Lolium perenne]|uniref:cytochrome P450 71A1-like n=1 Tax=Lolium perenne TaxID=4522 RepID=UPI0021F5150E|nr:cytochrome P450 71A1-like [Lolium perenne]
MADLELDSTLVLLSLVFVVSCVAIVVRGFGPGRKESVHALPPSPPALPIIGNLHKLGGIHLHRTLQALARRHGPLFLLRVGSVPLVVVSSASVAEVVLKTQDHIFCNRPQQYTARGLLYGCRDIAFSPYGEQWRQIRRVAVVHLLSLKRVDSFRALRVEEVSRFVQRIRAASGVGEDRGGVNVSELIIGLTNNVISKAAFGNKLGGVEPAMVRGLMKELTDVLSTFAVSDVFPRLGWLDWARGLDARVKRTAAKLDMVVERTIAEHEENRVNDYEARDLLDDLLSIYKDGDLGFKLDRTDVKALILDMFVAGTDTIYKTIEWTMAELIKNPRELEKVQSEVRSQVAGSAQARIVLEEELEKMSLLRAAIKEALRLHPALPLLVPRETIEDTRVDGYDIPAKTQVMVNTWAMGRDSESWENAEEFLPERFLGQAIGYSGKDTRFIPFGAGRRGCPGLAFATRLVELTLANMIYHFDWQLPNGQDLESFELTESTGVSPGLKSTLILAVKPL